MTLEQDAMYAMIELKEFYSIDDLCEFVDMCTADNLPLYKCALFLRGQTIAEYKINKDPNIYHMIGIVNQWVKNGGANYEQAS